MTLRALTSLAVLSALVLGGCKNHTEEPPTPVAKTAVGEPLPPEEPLPFKASWSRMAGTLDVRNRYLSTVSVETYAPMQAGVNGQCSGVLIGPTLVLTAGHCVCMKHQATTPEKAGRTLIDGSACATRPTVATVAYNPPLKDFDEHPTTGLASMPGYASQTYEGMEVWPHPDFQLVLDEQGRVEASRADLAVILLNEPVEIAFPATSLADTDVQVDEPFVMVGYTYDRIVGGISGQRRFSRYKVERLIPSDDDRAVFEQPGRDLYVGDSGGPCLRESAKSAVLVGISTRGLGDSPTFTRTYPYRSWLASQLERASQRRPSLHRGGKAHSPSNSNAP